MTDHATAMWLPISKTIWAWQWKREDFGYYALRQGVFGFIRPRIVRWVRADSGLGGVTMIPAGWRLELQDPQYQLGLHQASAMEAAKRARPKGLIEDDSASDAQTQKDTNT